MLSNMNLTKITMPQGIKITPGGYVSYAGDVNGDDYKDFFINTYSATYLIWGKATNWQDMYLSDLTISQGIKISCSDGIGSSIGVGDVNGDNIDDILVSSPNGGILSQGITYLIWGKSQNWHNIDLDNFDSSYGITIKGASYGDSSGYFISKLGDVNGDRYYDISIGTTHSINYLIWGKATGWQNIDLSSLVASWGVTIINSDNTHSGSFATYAGDVNGDDYKDFLIGTFYTGSPDTGASYLIWGKATGWQDVDLANFNTSWGIRIKNTNNINYANWPLSCAGDVNKDDYDDILIGSAELGTYLVWGRPTEWQNINLAAFNPSLGFIINAPTYFYYSGSPINSAGDISGNGYDGFLVEASITSYADTAIIYLFLGGTHLQNTNLAKFNSSQGVTIQNVYTYASLGGAGDVNKDDHDDILVGAAYGITTQASYLIFGGKIETPSPTINPDHPTTSTTIMPTAPTAPTMPTLPTTPYPTVEHPTIAPTNDTYAGSEPYSESWASSTAGIATIATLSTIFVVGSVALGTWCYYKHKTYDDKSYGLLANELDVLQ